jgi:methylated-DNA-[protein]-cysteine S-methyltransferase
VLVTFDGDALAGLRFATASTSAGDARGRPFDALVRALDRYWAGRRVDFDIPLAVRGTPFQRDVWRALQAVPYGETITYAELARRVGAPRAVRAVGRANGANPISIVIPCHRVVGSNGSLTGYGGGLERKRMLLELERGA